MGVTRGEMKATSRRATKAEKPSSRAPKQPDYSPEENASPKKWIYEQGYMFNGYQQPYEPYDPAYDSSYNDLVSHGASVDAYAKEAKTELNHKIVALGIYPSQNLLAVTKSTAHVLPASLALILMVLAVCNGYGYVKKMVGDTWERGDGSTRGGGKSTTAEKSDKSGRSDRAEKAYEGGKTENSGRSIRSMADGGESGGVIIGGGNNIECSCIGSDDEDTLRDPLLMSCMETPAGENVAIETDYYETAAGSPKSSARGVGLTVSPYECYEKSSGSPKSSARGGGPTVSPYECNEKSSGSPKSSARGGGPTVSPYECYETSSGSPKSSARGGGPTVSPYAWSPSNKSFIPTEIESNEDDEVCSGLGGSSARPSAIVTRGKGYMDATTASARSIGGPAAADATSADVVVDMADELIVHQKTPGLETTDPYLASATDNLQTATTTRSPEVEGFLEEEDGMEDDTLSSTDG